MLLAQDGARTRRPTKPRCHVRKLFPSSSGLRVYLALIQHGRRPSNSAVWWCRSWSRRCNLECSSSPRCVASQPGFTPLRSDYTAVYILVKRLESVLTSTLSVLRPEGRNVIQLVPREPLSHLRLMIPVGFFTFRQFSIVPNGKEYPIHGLAAHEPSSPTGWGHSCFRKILCHLDINVCQR
jgi:hypothetical protein